MGKQYHWVVVYDADTDSFELDYETVSLNFSNGQVWDKSTEEWRKLDLVELMDDDSEYNRADEALSRVLMTLKAIHSMNDLIEAIKNAKEAK